MAKFAAAYPGNEFVQQLVAQIPQGHNGELTEEATRAKFAQVADNGKPYLDHATRRARRHIPMTMEDWAKRIDIILEAGGDAVLPDAGKVTAEFAKKYAETEFEKYRVIQDRLFSSDFDRFNDGDNLLPIEIDPDNEQ